jgi:urease accessory protein
VAPALIRRRLAPLCAGTAALGLPSGALAHGNLQIGEFLGGLSHPIFHLESLLVMLAVLLWSVQASDPPLPRVPFAFALATVGGGAIAALGADLPPGPWIARAGALGLGLCVAARVGAPDRVAVPVAVLIGVAAGHSATWLERETLPRPWLYGLGLGTAVMIAWGYLASFALRFRAFWAQVAVRIVGSWIATVTLLVAALALARR